MSQRADTTVKTRIAPEDRKYLPKDLDVAALRRAAAGWAEMGKAQELPADIEPYGQARVEMLARINEGRLKNGLAPFVNDEDGNPDLTEKRRLRSEAYHREEQLKRERHPERLGFSRSR